MSRWWRRVVLAGVACAVPAVLLAQSGGLRDLREKLILMGEQDQQARFQLTAVLPASGAPDSSVAELIRELDQIDRANAEKLRQILDDHGWPLTSEVGEEAANAAFLVLQHAEHDPQLQRRGVELVRAAFAAGEVSGEALALLVDRVRVGAGEPQLYGTQAEIVSGRLQLMPMTAPELVDERRAELGLVPLQTYLTALRAAYGLEDQALE